MADGDSTEVKCDVTGFNYCFWAKALVAVPTLTILSFYSASFFANPFLQIVVGATVPVLAAWVAMKVDRMPGLSDMIVRHKK